MTEDGRRKTVFTPSAIFYPALIGFPQLQGRHFLYKKQHIALA